MLEAALLRTMTLLASLNVATELAFGIQERKAGRDPSTDEREEDLLPVLREELDTLKAIFFQLQSSLVLADNAPRAGTDIPEGLPSTEPVTRFIDLVRLQKSGNILHRVHQRLLSLYPAIDEHLAETARVLKNECDTLSALDATAFPRALSQFLNQAQPFINRLSRLID